MSVETTTLNKLEELERFSRHYCVVRNIILQVRGTQRNSITEPVLSLTNDDAGMHWDKYLETETIPSRSVSVMNVGILYSRYVTTEWPVFIMPFIDLDVYYRVSLQDCDSLLNCSFFEVGLNCYRSFWCVHRSAHFEIESSALQVSLLNRFVLHCVLFCNWYYIFGTIKTFLLDAVPTYCNLCLNFGISCISAFHYL